MKKLCCGIIVLSALLIGGCSSGGKASYREFERQVVYDARGILIEATGLSEDDNDLSITLNVQNSTNDDLKIYNYYFLVDGLMLPARGVIEAPANGEAAGSFRLERRMLKESGRENVGQLKLSLDINNVATDESCHTPAASVATPLADSVSPFADFAGDAVFDFESDQGQITVRYLGTTDAAYPGTSPVLVGFYVENNMNTPVSVSLYKAVINGQEVQAHSLRDVIPGKTAGYLPLTFSQDAMEAIGVKSAGDVDTIAFSVLGTDQELMIVIDGKPTAHVVYFNEQVASFDASQA